MFLFGYFLGIAQLLYVPIERGAAAPTLYFFFSAPIPIARCSLILTGYGIYVDLCMHVLCGCTKPAFCVCLDQSRWLGSLVSEGNSFVLLAAASPLAWGCRRGPLSLRLLLRTILLDSPVIETKNEQDETHSLSANLASVVGNGKKYAWGWQKSSLMLSLYGHHMSASSSSSSSSSPPHMHTVVVTSGNSLSTTPSTK